MIKKIYDYDINKLVNGKGRLKSECGTMELRGGKGIFICTINNSPGFFSCKTPKDRQIIKNQLNQLIEDGYKFEWEK